MAINSDDSLRQHLHYLLNGGGAHIDFEGAIKSFPAVLRGKRPKGSPHSPWELLEHMRIAQWDILNFTRDPDHVSPDFPAGYWPASAEPPNNRAWNLSADAFRSDLNAMKALVADKSVNLFAPIPHGDGQTVLREALLVADHNSYHLGQLMLLRRTLE
jgi:hypothetical protein